MSGYTVRLQCSFVYNGGFAAFSIQRAVGFIPLFLETNPSIEWSIAANTSPYKPGAKSCKPCFDEKLTILQSNPATTVNKKSELNSKGRSKTSSN